MYYRLYTVRPAAGALVLREERAVWREDAARLGLGDYFSLLGRVLVLLKDMLETDIRKGLPPRAGVVEILGKLTEDMVALQEFYPARKREKSYRS